MILANGLSRSFGVRPAVEGLSFSVPEGNLCALLGPNGAGKTTTVRLLLGLLPPSAGSAVVAGVTLPGDEAEGAKLRRQAGLLTETPGFYDRMSGRENLELFGRLYGLGETELRARGEQWLKRMQLWEARDQPFGTWSKGMKQRLALIRAVLHEPRVLFLDEPTSGLDPAAARDVRDLIAGFRREGRTILLCTHNLAEAHELADLIGIIRRRMLAFGPPASLAADQPGLAIRLAGEAAPLAEELAALPAVRRSVAEGNTLRLVLDDLDRDTPAIVREIVRRGGSVLAVSPAGLSLEEVYLRAVREDPGMTRAILGLFLLKEARDLRSNRQVWPAYFLLPAVAVLLPVVALVVVPLLADPAHFGNDPGVDLLIKTVANDPTLKGATLQEKLARLLLRDLGMFHLLMGVILASGAAALALVREKEQRTLEPILATPLRDHELLLAKLVAAIGPAIAVTWGSALAGTMAGMLAGLWRIGALILPTAGNLVAWILLAPALAMLGALGGLRVSARFTDVPGATQFTGLVVVPVTLVVVALLGRPAMASPLVGLGGALVVGLISLRLFYSNLRRFRREEILTKWR